MAGDSPRQALDTFIERFRGSIACIGEAYIFGDGDELNLPHAIAMKPYQPGFDGRLQLRAKDSGRPDLLLDITHEYTVIHVPEDDRRGPYSIRSTSYLYEIFDLEGRELFLYHWHPQGVSDVTFPHVHAACAPRIFLSRPHTQQVRAIDVDRLHLPTSYMFLEDIIELLIRDFGVEPEPEFRIDDAWKNVLDRNREMTRRDSSWP